MYMATPSWNSPSTAARRRRDVGRFETAYRRRAYFPEGCCISRPPDAGIASACARRIGHKKPTGLTEVGTAVRGVSTLLGGESATTLEPRQLRQQDINEYTEISEYILLKI